MGHRPDTPDHVRFAEEERTATSSASGAMTFILSASFRVLLVGAIVRIRLPGGGWVLKTTRELVDTLEPTW